ncbi:CinA family protein [Marihabitans asiaticum]|uniref:Nicotinamide-nucleotide amidase n=1 Tax=Marihabitans asiaticum TaxID=415218 RepID=A0A560W7X0_9MICO|nr:CinA family protein [Marihabitans asiaticum]TWD13680.1 nicotinamide-nucleotide amidase [Marihabitans asiaticum]
MRRDPAEMAAELLAQLRAKGATLGCAESLTGGLLATTVVGVPGASDVFRGGVIAYAPEVKTDLLGVEHDLIARVGTVHPAVAEQMARGALRELGCDIGLATTGVAGPGSNEGHPAGTVYLACATRGDCTVRRRDLEGDRYGVRRAAVGEALDLALTVLAER